MTRLVNKYSSLIVPSLSNPQDIIKHTYTRLIASHSSIGEYHLALRTEMDLATLKMFNQDLTQNPYDFIEKLRNLHRKIFTRQRLVGSVTVNNQDKDIINPSLEALVQRLQNGEPAVPHDIQSFVPSKLGLASPLETNFIGLGAGLHSKTGLPWRKEGVAAVAHAVINRYLDHTIRNVGNAYGAFSNFDEETSTAVFCSWRDPNISKTIVNFKDSVNFLRSVSEDLLARAKVEAIKPYHRVISPSDLGNLGVNRMIYGISAEDLDDMRAQVIDATLDDMRLYANALEEGINRNDFSIVVYGNKVALEKARSEGVDLEIMDRSQASFPRRS